MKPLHLMSVSEQVAAHFREEIHTGVLEWAENVSSGKEDKRQVLSKSVFVKGSTIGPPPRKK